MCNIAGSVMTNQKSILNLSKSNDNSATDNKHRATKTGEKHRRIRDKEEPVTNQPGKSAEKAVLGAAERFSREAKLFESSRLRNPMAAR